MIPAQFWVIVTHPGPRYPTGRVKRRSSRRQAPERLIKGGLPPPRRRWITIAGQIVVRNFSDCSGT